MPPFIIKMVIVGVVSGALYLLWLLPEPADSPLGYETLTRLDDGATIASYRTGESGSTVLLLASLGRSVSDFNMLVTALTEVGFRTVAVEFRGVGASTLAPHHNALTLFDYASDIHDAVFDGKDTSDENAVGPIAVIGHAFGNRVARSYATQYADSVDSVVLIAAGGSQKLRPEQRISQALGNCFDWKMFPPKRIREIHYAFFSDTNEVPDSWKRGWHKAAATAQIKAVGNTDAAAWRAAGGWAPILILQGEHDRIAPPETTSNKLKSDFPERVQVVTIEKAGHALLPEQPEKIAQEIIKFLRDI